MIGLTQLEEKLQKLWNYAIDCKASNCLSSMSMKSVSGKICCTGTKSINYPNATKSYPIFTVSM